MLKNTLYEIRFLRNRAICAFCLKDAIKIEKRSISKINESFRNTMRIINFKFL